MLNSITITGYRFKPLIYDYSKFELPNIHENIVTIYPKKPTTLVRFLKQVEKFLEENNITAKRSLYVIVKYQDHFNFEFSEKEISLIAKLKLKVAITCYEQP